MHVGTVICGQNCHELICNSSVIVTTLMVSCLIQPLPYLHPIYKTHIPYLKQHDWLTPVLFICGFLIECRCRSIHNNALIKKKCNKHVYILVTPLAIHMEHQNGKSTSSVIWVISLLGKNFSSHLRQQCLSV